jgi:hypothetical protein
MSTLRTGCKVVSLRVTCLEGRQYILNLLNIELITRTIGDTYSTMPFLMRGSEFHEGLAVRLCEPIKTWAIKPTYFSWHALESRFSKFRKFDQTHDSPPPNPPQWPKLTPVCAETPLEYTSSNSE